MANEIRTVMLADLTSYTALWNDLGATRAIEILNEAFTVAGDIILANHGTIHKYIGDAILASFLDPDTAKNAATELRHRYDKTIEGHHVAFHISVVTGEAFVVKVGHPSLIQDDLMGDAVNRAFRTIGN